MAPGRYRLTLGLYPLDDPAARLPVTWTPAEQSNSETGDSYPLSLITVR
jgi:hypothetical protein